MLDGGHRGASCDHSKGCVLDFLQRFCAAKGVQIGDAYSKTGLIKAWWATMRVPLLCPHVVPASAFKIFTLLLLAAASLQCGPNFRAVSKATPRIFGVFAIMRAFSLIFTSGVILCFLVLGVKSVTEHFSVDTSKSRETRKLQSVVR